MILHAQALGIATLLILFCLTPLIAAILWQRREETQEIRERVRRIRSVYTIEPPQDFKVVQGHEISGPDHRFYDNTMWRLERHAFRFITDFQEVLSPLFTEYVRPSYCRLMAMDSGQIMAAIFQALPLNEQVTPTIFGPTTNLRSVSFVTQLAKGDFIETTNAATLAHYDPVPGANILHLPSGTATLVMLERHRQRVVAFLNEHSDATITPLTTLQDFAVHSKKAYLRKKAYRLQKGGLSAEEILRVFPGLPHTMRGRLFLKILRKEQQVARLEYLQMHGTGSEQAPPVEPASI